MSEYKLEREISEKERGNERIEVSKCHGEARNERLRFGLRAMQMRRQAPIHVTTRLVTAMTKHTVASYCTYSSVVPI